MTDTTHGLSDDVLEQAAEAFNDTFSYGAVPTEDALIAALPILRDAIETALLQRMIADCDKQMEEFGVNEMDAYMRIRLTVYLPAATEGADHE